MLELALWKSKIEEQSDGVIDVLDADMKMGCRIDSLSMVDIIVPTVLSFLHGNANEGDDGDEDNDGDDDKDNRDDDSDDGDSDKVNGDIDGDDEDDWYLKLIGCF